MVTVWVDDWQQECCGEPFALGHEVRWELGTPDGDHLEALFRAEDGVTVTHAQESHRAGGEPPTRTTVGRVMGIRGVQLRYEGEEVCRPVRGSARLTVLAESDGPELRWPGFAGYLVDLDVVARARPDPRRRAEGPAGPARAARQDRARRVEHPPRHQQRTRPVHDRGQPSGSGGRRAVEVRTCPVR